MFLMSEVPLCLASSARYSAAVVHHGPEKKHVKEASRRSFRHSTPSYIIPDTSVQGISEKIPDTSVQGISEIEPPLL